MQSLAQVSSKGTSYSGVAVAALLSGPNLQQRWVFDRIQSNGQLSDLTRYVDTSTVPEITYDSEAAVKRSIRMQLRGDAPLLSLSDLIRVHHQVLAADGGWLDWPLGTFVLVPPERVITPTYTQRLIEALDMTQLLVDAEFLESYGVSAGASYIQSAVAIGQLYGGQIPLQFSIPDNLKTLPQSLGWQAGQTRLSAMNQLFLNNGYVSLWSDAMGVLRTGPLPDYTLTLPSYTFDQLHNAGIVISPLGDRPDPARMYNIVVVKGEDERRVPFSFSWVNPSPLAEASALRWRPKVKIISGSDIADASVAQQVAQSEGQASARVYSVLEVNTFPWSVSEDRDLFRLIYNSVDDGLQVNDYVEIKWVHRCAVGAPTTHFFERVVA
jgi:hypothetical protein